MLEKLKQPECLKKSYLELYHKGKFEEILKQKNELINIVLLDLYNILGSTLDWNQLLGKQLKLILVIF